MDRFKLPDTPEVVAYCCHCQEELEEGTEVTEFEDEVFCDDYCFLKYMNVSHVIL